MGLFSKMPSPKQVERARANLGAATKQAVQDSKARSAGFWEDYERRNGKGSVDYS